jgi:hypothetical protein
LNNAKEQPGRSTASSRTGISVSPEKPDILAAATAKTSFPHPQTVCLLINVISDSHKRLWLADNRLI